MVIFFVVSIFISPVFAANKTFQVAAGNWQTNGSWNGGRPAAADTALINNGGTATISTNAATATNLYLGQNTGDSGYVTMTTQTTTISGSAYIGNSGTGIFTETSGTSRIANMYLGALSGGSGTYNLNGGTLSTNQIFNGAGTGTFNINAGTFTLNGNTVNVDNLNIGNTSAATGTWTLATGKNLTVTNFNVGNSGGGTFTQSGGTATITALYIGRNSGSSGVVNLNGGVTSVTNITMGSGASETLAMGGGTLNVTGNILFASGGTFTRGTSNITMNGTGSQDIASAGKSFYDLTVNKTAGVLTTPDAFATTNNLTLTNGTMTQTANTNTVGNNMAIGSGTYNLNGGTLSVVGSITNATGAGTLNIDGGTLSLIGNTADIDSLNIGNADSTVGAFTLQSGKTLSIGEETVGGSGTGTFTQAGGTNTISGTLYLGRISGGSGTYTLNGGVLSVASIGNGPGIGTLILDGGTLDMASNSLNVDNFNIGFGAGKTSSYALSSGKSITADTVNLGVSGSGTLTQTGGTATISSALNLAANSGSTGVYNINGGVVNVNGSITQGSGYSEINMNGGTINFGGSTVNIDKLLVGDTVGQSAIFNTGTNKTLTIGTLEIGTYGQGTFDQTGGTVNITASDIYIGRYADSTGYHNINGGVLAGSVNMIIENTATSNGELKGYGNVALTGSLTNNGRVIADGQYNNTRDLVMSNLSSINNTIENTSNNGWFAVNGGELTLPAIYIDTGTHTYNWGESQSDSEIDMIHSVQLTFKNVTTPGWLTIKLVAAGHEGAPPTYRPNGMWSFEAPTIVYDSVDMAFRYDDTIVPTEEELAAWHYLNGSWYDVTSRLDISKNIVYVDNAHGFSYYAVGKGTDVVPEPTTVISIGVTVLGLLRRKLRKLSDKLIAKRRPKSHDYL